MATSKMNIPQDKANHVVWCGVLTLLSIVVLEATHMQKPLIGLTTCIGALALSLLKETRDAYGFGTPEVLDVVAGMCGWGLVAIGYLVG